MYTLKDIGITQHVYTIVTPYMRTIYRCFYIIISVKFYIARESHMFTIFHAYRVVNVTNCTLVWYMCKYNFKYNYGNTYESYNYTIRVTTYHRPYLFSTGQISLIDKIQYSLTCIVIIGIILYIKQFGKPYFSSSPYSLLEKSYC